MCDRVASLDARTRVLVLQDPHEPDVVLGTVQILQAALPGCTVAVGRQWSSLADALGEAPGDGRWGVLWRASLPEGVDVDALPGPVAVLDRAGRPRPAGHALAGIVALDGTWSQAKSLWWRNPWLLQLDRVVVTPGEPGIYGKLRREPNRLAVSTLEAVAEALVANGESPEVRASLRRWMRTLVQRARDTDPRKGRAGGPGGADVG
ncbi:MAG: DTW domain-containing protein [Alphaproteobacteria bacterium]|nr:DTW domain-containing protein [Alphaproteobacteria bacterium]